jgi:hypothetical protein
MALTEHGYPDYPRVPVDVELPNMPAPETLIPEHSGDDESWKGGPDGQQPGFDIPGVSPMSPNFGEVFGPQRG